MTSRHRSFHCRLALVDGAFAADVRVTLADGVVTALETGVPQRPGDVALELVVPGFVNAHSHAFHRELRGHTHCDGGDFWQWRNHMYDSASRLTPERYRELAEQVFTEMRDAGYTAVGEFHYVHHEPDGRRYPRHDMEIALADAATAAGIRLVLLDTCYLRGGIGRPLDDRQRRFGDSDVHGWLQRWHGLRDALGTGGRELVTLGAAIHSVRAVTPHDLAELAEHLPADVPVHAHVSEQPAENDACIAAYGRTPVGLLADCGMLTPRFSAVHATHLSDDDIRLLGTAATTVVMCPTTEADLGDGIGPAPELLAAGAGLAIGSDQHAVIDPWEELARLELDQRLRHHRRGVLAPELLWQAGSLGGLRSLALPTGSRRTPGFAVGLPFDAVEIDMQRPRTRGAQPAQLPLVARSCDVTATIVGGRLTRPSSARV